MDWPQMRSSIAAMDEHGVATRPEGTPLVSQVIYPRGAYKSETAADTESEAVLQDTLHSQPATVAVAVGAFEIFKAAGLEPNFAAGHSLGEIAALHAAGVLERDAAFGLVCARAAAMAGAAKSAGRGHAMAAVIGKGAAELRVSRNDVWLANINEPGQVVISGSADAVKAESDALSAKGFRVVPLKVSGAFHTPLMQQAGSALVPLRGDHNSNNANWDLYA